MSERYLGGVNVVNRNAYSTPPTNYNSGGGLVPGLTGGAQQPAVSQTELARQASQAAMEQGKKDQFQDWAKYGQNAAPCGAMTWCRCYQTACGRNSNTVQLYDASTGANIVREAWEDFEWGAGLPHASAVTALAVMEFYFFALLRLPLIVIVWIQMFIQDGFMNLQGFVILFGAFMVLELGMWLFASMIKATKSGSFLTAHLFAAQTALTIVQLFSFVVLLNVYLSSRNKAGFDFEAAIPSGTGISTNDAWNKGTSILAIPSNVYVNDQITSMMAMWSVLYFIFGGSLVFAIAHGQHPYKNAMY